MNFVRLSAFACGMALSCATAALANIHPGDKLSVSVYNHPEISAQVTVDSLGRISLPLVGVLEVGGQSAQGAGSIVSTALRQYIRYPAVDIQVLSEGDSAFISGGPGGVVTLQPGETLTAALSSIPTFDGSDIRHSRVDLTKVSVERDGRLLGTFDADTLSDAGGSGPVLSPGDTIVLVNKPVRVEVRGEVKNPGTTFLADDEPLSDAIRQVGGLLPDAADAQYQLVRSGATTTVAYGSAVFSDPASNGDVVVIPSAPEVEVTGVVVKPGQVTLRTDFTLISALYEAGGPARYANIKAVRVVRNGVATSYNVTALTRGDMSQNPTLHDGDLVVVPEGSHFDFADAVSALFSSIYAIWDATHW